MTRNQKIELAKKACEIQKKETKEAIIRASIIATISFIGALIGLLASSPNFPTAFLRVIGILLILLTVLCVFTAICYSLRHKLFIKLVNEHEFEVVEKEFDGDLWYCVHIPETTGFFRAEKVQKEET